ncbi:MAG: glycoside hydrolase family 16 protein [Clostridia bacterium]|nr:glycoside hydrolase family 16 protein [Clostridia bacterium]
MKKLRLTAFVLAILMLLASCGGSKPAETTSPQTSATTEASTQATTEATTAPQIKAEEWVIITSFSEVNANYWKATSYLADAIDAITGKYPELVDDISYKEDKYGENVGKVYLGNTKFDPSAELKALGLGTVGYAYKVNSPLEIAICSATDYALVKAVKAFCADVLGYDGETVPEEMTLTVGAQYLYDGDYEIDLTGYELVFEDEFEGTELDLEKREHRGLGERRGGYNSSETVSVRDGSLVIKYGYLEDGEYGEGWYAGMIRAKERFLRGYFEVRMICVDQKPANFWSAFWLQGNHPYDELSYGGIGSAEIDIVEAFREGLNKDGPMQMTSTVHCFGYAEGGMSSALRSSPTNCVPVEDMCTAYHTYGLEWTEDEYRFFLDGKCVYELVWADGITTDMEEMVVSLEIPGEDDCEKADKSISGEMFVDYVKVYQIP